MQLSYCVTVAAQLLYVTFYAKRHYKWLDFKAQPDHAAISQKNSVLVHQVSGMVFNNTDIILLSFLTDFNTVSIYYIYNLFFSQVEVFINGLVKGFNFALGQLFSLDKEAFIKKIPNLRKPFRGVEFCGLHGYVPVSSPDNSDLHRRHKRRRLH